MKTGDTAKDSIRVLLVGFGLSGRVFHGPLIKATLGMEITGIVTGDKTRQESARDSFPNAVIYPTLDLALSQQNQFDLVVIASATSMHLTQCLEALEYGANVVVEKPIAGTEKDALEIEICSTRTNRSVHVFHNRRWDSDFLTLQHLSQNAAKGDIKRFVSRMESFNPVVHESWRNSPDPQALGGALLDLGVHLVDQAIELMGPVYSVFSELKTIRKHDTAEDQFVILLRHSNDASSFLIGSKAQRSIGSRFLVIGERGRIRINSYDSQESELRKGAIPDQSSWGLEPPSSFAEIETTASGNQTGMNRFPFLRGRWNFFYNEVFNSITNGTASPVHISDAINNMRVLDAARKSHINRTECLLNIPASHITEKSIPRRKQLSTRKSDS